MAYEPYVSDAATAHGIESEIRFDQPFDGRCWHVRVSRLGYTTHFSSHHTRVVALRRVEHLRRLLEVRS